MFFEFVYVGYTEKRCIDFINGIAGKLKEHGKNFEYDKRQLMIKTELFKCTALPINFNYFYNLGIRNTDYICSETAYPKPFLPITQEHVRIADILEDISTRFIKRPKEKSEKELGELIDTLIEV